MGLHGGGSGSRAVLDRDDLPGSRTTRRLIAGARPVRVTSEDADDPSSRAARSRCPATSTPAAPARVPLHDLTPHATIPQHAAPTFTCTSRARRGRPPARPSSTARPVRQQRGAATAMAAALLFSDRLEGDGPGGHPDTIGILGPVELPSCPTASRGAQLPPPGRDDPPAGLRGDPRSRRRQAVIDTRALFYDGNSQGGSSAAR